MGPCRRNPKGVRGLRAAAIWTCRCARRSFVVPALPFRRTQTPRARRGRVFGRASSVVCQKFAAYSGEPSAAPARRADDEIPGVFGGGPTQPGASRAGGIDKKLLERDTSGREVPSVPPDNLARDQRYASARYMRSSHRWNVTPEPGLTPTGGKIRTNPMDEPSGFGIRNRPKGFSVSRVPVSRARTSRKRGGGGACPRLSRHTPLYDCRP